MKQNYAIDCTHFVKGTIGGAETYLLNLLDGFIENNVNGITIFILKSQTTHFNKYEKYFNIITVNISNKYLRILCQNIMVTFQSRRFKVFLFPFNFRPILMLCKSATVIHDIQYIYYPSYWPKMMLYYRRFFIPYSIANSTKIITISNAVKNEILSNFSRDKIEVIYNPLKKIDNFLIRKVETPEKIHFSTIFISTS